VGSWSPSEVPPGQALREPSPLFTKLDPDKVVAEELERMEQVALSTGAGEGDEAAQA
jgi:hypothetical protein